MLNKRGVLKNFSKFSDKHKKQPSEVFWSRNVLKNYCKIYRKNIFVGVSFLTKLQAGNLKLAKAAA